MAYDCECHTMPYRDARAGDGQQTSGRQVQRRQPVAAATGAPRCHAPPPGQTPMIADSDQGNLREEPTCRPPRRPIRGRSSIGSHTEKWRHRWPRGSGCRCATSCRQGGRSSVNARGCPLAGARPQTVPPEPAGSRRARAMCVWCRVRGWGHGRQVMDEIVARDIDWNEMVEWRSARARILSGSGLQVGICLLSAEDIYGL